jgi:hypothetical protein
MLLTLARLNKQYIKNTANNIAAVNIKKQKNNLIRIVALMEYYT